MENVFKCSLHLMFVVLVVRQGDNEAFGCFTEGYESCLMLLSGFSWVCESHIQQKDESLSPMWPLYSWRNWIPGALILFPVSARSGGSTSTSQVLIQSQRCFKSLACKLHCLHFIHLHHEVQLLDGLLAAKADCNLGCNRASASSTGSAWRLPKTNGATNLSLIFDALVRDNTLRCG